MNLDSIAGINATGVHRKASEDTPAGHWHTLTLLGAITANGVPATWTVESPTDREVFLAYLD